MERAMRNTNLAAAALRLRLAILALGPVLCSAALLLVAAGATLAWLLPQRALQADRHQVAMRLALTPPVTQAKSAPVTANENLLAFYGTLGEKRYAEQQVKTLFGLAAKANLSLSQGEYKSAYDRNARLHSYQVTLPVNGSYRDVWQFGMLSLRAIPFASLDEISFKRENIGEARIEARLRLTLYLAERPGAPR
jgi:hypothetical protein